MKKNYKAKLLGAIAALGLAVASTVGSTYAWFSMNSKVEVTGMQVKTRVSSNLLIADGTSVATTAKAAEANFGANFAGTMKGIIEPSSTVDGLNFWYTTNAKADGSKSSGDYVEYGAEATLSSEDAAKYNDAFSKAYSVSKEDAPTILAGQTGAVPYVDYIIQLKAVNTKGTAVSIKLTKLDLEYTKAASEADAENAYRVAVFCQKESAGAFSDSEGTLSGIYAPTSAVNQTTGKAVNGATTLGEVTYNNAEKLTDVTANSTEYFKVVIRLWLEGEDKTCTNDKFLALTGSWELKANFELDTATAAVNALTIKAAGA